MSQWCHPTISFSAISSPFAFHLSQHQDLFTSGGQSIGASASASVLPMNIQNWFPLGLTSLISLQSKGFSRVFSSTTDQKHQFFSAQPSLLSNSHISTWLPGVISLSRRYWWGLKTFFIGTTWGRGAPGNLSVEGKHAAAVYPPGQRTALLDKQLSILWLSNWPPARDAEMNKALPSRDSQPR